MNTSVTLAVLILSSLLVAYIVLRRKPNFPPGPSGYPLIGNILDLPSGGFDWIVYSKWANLYGPYHKAIELLDNKGSKYSGRPHLTMPVDLMGFGKFYPLVPYGPRLRGYRKVFHEQLGNRSAMAQFYPQEQDQSKAFIRRCFLQPSRLREHCFHMASCNILQIAYGYAPKDEHDEIIRLSQAAMEAVNEGATPSKFLVNVVPALRWVPEWIPGAAFQRKAREYRTLYEDYVDKPFNWLKEQIAAGRARDSFTANWLRKGLSSLEQDYLKHAAGSMMGAGGETSAVAIHFFFLAMIRWPHVQHRLQTELMSVVRSDRLPTFADRDSLPYLDAVIKEILRFHPVIPFGIPHSNTEDDIHDGYFIPKNAIIIANIWHMCRDPETYFDPDTFNPERFMGDKPELDPRHIVFGFGRRICPGKHLADTSIYITLALTIFAFEIKPVVKDGQEVIPEIKGSGETSNQLEAFPCTLLPRDEAALKRLFWN